AASHMSSNSIKVLALVATPPATPTAGPRSAGGVFSQDTTYAYPNPARGGDVKFQFQLPASSVVEIRVFDVTGAAVWGETLQASQTQAGANLVDWNLANQAGGKLASGIYIYRVTVGGQTATHKLAIIH
ncbi:MAG TPA: T9SS type A sorting domain-containing protein, partial [bacterium]|nr:T9SS type A sorting domain-containing protein [bacterium]